MAFRHKELGIRLTGEALDFCPTASATISFDARESRGEIDFDLLRAQMREALREETETR